VDSLNEALVECVKACGGSKQVAGSLWPEKSPEAAQRMLLDCLNDDRAAHLSPDHVVMVLQMARNKGCHVGINYLAERLGYSQPNPIEPSDEAADLQRKFIAATAGMAAMLARMEKLQSDMRPSTPTLRAA